MPKTHPHHVFDSLLWPALRLFWEPFSRKQSHWWHWKPIDTNESIPLLAITPDPSAAKRGNPWSVFWQTNFGWSKVVVLEPVDYGGEYHVGYLAYEARGRKSEVCSVVLCGRSAALVGSHELRFFALSFPDNKPLQLREIKRVRKSELDKDIFLV